MAAIATNWQQGEAGYLVRFFPAEWLPNLPRFSRWERYFNDCRVPASNPTSALLVQSKRFPLVWDKLSTPLPTWRAMLPETRDLRTIRDSEDGQWVLKPVFGRAGKNGPK
jgi:glutathionylspermidine synthase